MGPLTLATRTRSCALRLAAPAARVSRPTAPRRAFHSTPTAGQQHGKGFNLETASEEEVMRQAHLVEKEIGECFDRVRLDNKKLPGIWKDMFGTMKLWFCTGAAIELMVLSPNSRCRTTAEAPDE